MRDFQAYKNDEWVVTYTCNSPNEEVLKKNWVKAIGDSFGIWAIEVLLIPYKLFKWMFLRSDAEIESNAQKIIRNLR